MLGAQKFGGQIWPLDFMMALERSETNLDGFGPFLARKVPFCMLIKISIVSMDTRKRMILVNRHIDNIGQQTRLYKAIPVCNLPLFSQEKGGCMKGYLGVDAAKGYLEVDSASCRSGSSSSVNSLKSAFDPHAFDKAPPGGRPYHSSPRSSKKGYHHQERTYQDRTYQERTYQGPSDQRTFSTYNFCPFMDCKHYNVALQAEGTSQKSRSIF